MVVESGFPRLLYQPKISQTMLRRCVYFIQYKDFVVERRDIFFVVCDSAFDSVERACFVLQINSPDSIDVIRIGKFSEETHT